MDFIIFKYEVGALVGTNDSYPVIVMYVNIGHSHMMCSSPAVYGIIDVIVEFAIFNNNVVCVAGVKQDNESIATEIRLAKDRMLKSLRRFDATAADENLSAYERMEAERN